MKSLLKGLSVVEIIIGIIGLIVGGLALAGAGIMAPDAVTDPENQVVMLFRVHGILLALSGVFNLVCGMKGLGGAKGDGKKLSAAITLGWVGLLAAVFSAAMTLIGNVHIGSVISAVCSAIIPVLFLVSAYGSRK